MYLRYIFPLFLVIWMYGCSSTPDYASKKELTQEERLQIEDEELAKILDLDFSVDSVKLDSVAFVTGEELTKLYELNQNKLFWFKDGKQLPKTEFILRYLSQSIYYGIDSGFYYYETIKAGLDTIKKSQNFYSIAKAEALCDVLFTNAWLSAATHLSKGFINPLTNKYQWKVDSLENKNLAQQLFDCKDTSLLSALNGFEPQNIEYRYMKLATKNFVDQYELDTFKFILPDPKKDSAACWNQMAKALLHWKRVDSLNVPRDTLILAVKDFQAFNGLDPDAKIGDLTKTAFATSNNDRYYKIALALEKWRWKKKRDGKIQFHVNIPAYTLHVIRNDSLIRRHRVVTGTPDHRTPTLEAKVRYVTLFPYWNVPHSISTKEILPFVKRDTNYLHKHNYQVFKHDKTPVRASDVNWRKLSENYFPYRIRQNGGYGNSLGVIVFHFPNKYDVYLHDTPSKNFFKKSVRCFSHGCIRLQNPLDFGVFVLKQDRPKDTINVDTLKAWVEKKTEMRMALRKPIPIELDYITTTSDSLGNILFHPDVYHYEESLVLMMNPKAKKKPVNVPKESPKEEKTAFLPERRKTVFNS